MAINIKPKYLKKQWLWSYVVVYGHLSERKKKLYDTRVEILSFSIDRLIYLSAKCQESSNRK